jgi:hypothetical protein
MNWEQMCRVTIAWSGADIPETALAAWREVEEGFILSARKANDG